MSVRCATRNGLLAASARRIDGNASAAPAATPVVMTWRRVNLFWFMGTPDCSLAPSNSISSLPVQFICALAHVEARFTVEGDAVIRRADFLAVDPCDSDPVHRADGGVR